MSLWTGASSFRLTRELAMLYSLSVASMPSVFSDTEFVCDAKALQIADRLGWEFTSEAVALNDFCHESERHVWMLGKLEASSIQTVPHCHIDLDLIVERLPERVLSARVAVQGRDHHDAYIQRETIAIMDSCGVPRSASPYNTGIMLWNDLRLRSEYCAAARLAASKASRHSQNGTLISIVCEQSMLGHITSLARVRVERCIGSPEMLCREDFEHGDCKFIHLWGRSKGIGKWMSKVERRFADSFPEKYSQFKRGAVILAERGIIT